MLIIKVNGRQTEVSIDRVKPAFLKKSCITSSVQTLVRQESQRLIRSVRFTDNYRG